MELSHVLVYSLSALLIIYALVLYWFRGAGKSLFLTAPSMFMGWQLLRLIGTTYSVDISDSNDRNYLLVVVGGLFCFVIGVVIANILVDFRPQTEIRRFVESPTTYDLQGILFVVGVLGMGVVCLFVGTYFAIAVGYNTFFTALVAMIQGQEFAGSEYSLLRTSISRATDAYYAPGYTLQFTAVLLPVILCLLYFRVIRSRRRLEALLLISLAAADFYFLTILGGRAFAFNAVLIFALLVSPFGPIPHIWPIVRRAALGCLLLMAVFYALSTTLMGRASGSAGSLVGDAFNRLVGGQSQAEVEVMRLIMPEPAYFGQEWWSSLLTVLPGSPKGYGLTTELHALLYGGNDRGSFGLPLWGSLWYNWGFLGTLILAFLLGLLMQRFTIWYVRGSRKLTRMVILFAISFRLAQIRDPYSVLLEGVFTLIVFHVIVFSMQVAGRMAEHQPPNEGGQHVSLSPPNSGSVIAR